MKAWPIIFSAPMVMALLEGRKTQTRRLAWTDAQKPTVWQLVAPGDHLWVKEAVEASGALVQYVAGRKTSLHIWPAKWRGFSQRAMFMPRIFSRLTLTVTAVAVQRLHDMTASEAIAEGVVESPHSTNWNGVSYTVPDTGIEECTFARGAFGVLWKRLHGIESWDSDPAVVVLYFTVERRNIDQEA